MYQELCANNAEAVMKARSEGVRDNRELLLLFASFSETRFEKILSFQDTETRWKQYSYYLLFYNQIIFRKCGKKSVELRNTGNKLYSAMKNSEALQMYTRAVQFAPHDQIYKVFSQNSPLKTPFTIFQQGKELSLALANRSAVLFKLGEFKWVSKTFVNGMKF